MSSIFYDTPSNIKVELRYDYDNIEASEYHTRKQRTLLGVHVKSNHTRRVPIVEQELLTLPEHMSSPPVFSGVCVTQSLVLCVFFVDRCLSFCTFSWPLCCLFFDILILITPLISSNSSYSTYKMYNESNNWRTGYTDETNMITRTIVKIKQHLWEKEVILASW
jgi:hypothetical protein